MDVYVWGVFMAVYQKTFEKAVGTNFKGLKMLCGEVYHVVNHICNNNSPYYFCGGADETRTRGLWRDRPAL
jgi:hypothetical protein